jgi:predicted nucleic acid-binding protein
MILRRLTANLKAQNWTAITVEFVIVVLGVFIGTWVASWNQQRASKAETRRMVAQLKPQLDTLDTYFRVARDYYAITRGYATTAIAGWRGDRRVSDHDFVIAAYQASQILTLGTNGSAWSTVLGADRLRDIGDPQMRIDLSFLMSADYSAIDLPAIDTPYRHNVRRIIPVEIQDAIRAQCGDQPNPLYPSFTTLPAKCALPLAPGDAARAASLLRAHPELLEDLQWHIAAVSAFLSNIVPFEAATRRLEHRATASEE